MKKFLTITTTCTMLTVHATAVQKCVALNSTTTSCTGTSTKTYGTPDWSATCTTNNRPVYVYGIATCANASSSGMGSRYGGRFESVSSANDTSNIHCWCKIVYPATSSEWMYFDPEGVGSLNPQGGGADSFRFSTPAQCAYKCAAYCSLGFQYYPSSFLSNYFM